MVYEDIKVEKKFTVFKKESLRFDKQFAIHGKALIKTNQALTGARKFMKKQRRLA